MAQRLGTGLGLERGKKEETDERVLELARLAAIDSPLLGHSQPIHAVITQPYSEIRDPLALRQSIPSRLPSRIVSHKLAAVAGPAAHPLKFSSPCAPSL